MSLNISKKIDLLVKTENRSKILKNILNHIESVNAKQYFSTDQKEIDKIKNMVQNMKNELLDGIKTIEAEENDNYVNSSEDDDKLTEKFIRNINKIDFNRKLYEDGENKISTSHILMNRVNVGIHSIGEYFNTRKMLIVKYKNQLTFACIAFMLICFLLVIYKLSY